MNINNNLTINNIKAHIRYILNTTDDYDVKYNGHILEGDLKINQTSIAEQGIVDVALRRTENSAKDRPKKTKPQDVKYKKEEKHRKQIPEKVIENL